MYEFDNGKFGYIWNKNFILPYESMWSIFEKFKYFNALTNKDLKKLNIIRSYSRFKVSDYFYINIQIVQKHEKDLINLFKIDIDRHFKFMKMFIWNDYYEYFNDQIKICPLCIKNGYHSYIHQFLWEENCFIHPNNKLIATNLKYSIGNEADSPYGNDDEIFKNIEPSSNILYKILSKNTISKFNNLKPYNENIKHIGIFNFNNGHSKNKYKYTWNNTQACIHEIFNNNLKSGSVVYEINKKRAELVWRTYNYLDDIHDVFFRNRWFRDYAYSYSMELYNNFDKEIIESTLTNVRSSYGLYALGGELYDYNSKAIAIIITACNLTSYNNLNNKISDAFGYYWKKNNNNFCLLEEEFRNYVDKCEYNFQKTIILELYKIIAKKLYNIIYKRASTGYYDKKIDFELVDHICFPHYIVIEENYCLKIIEVDDGN